MVFFVRCEPLVAGIALGVLIILRVAILEGLEGIGSSASSTSSTIRCWLKPSRLKPGRDSPGGLAPRPLPTVFFIPAMAETKLHDRIGYSYRISLRTPLHLLWPVKISSVRALSTLARSRLKETREGATEKQGVESCPNVGQGHGLTSQ